MKTSKYLTIGLLSVSLIGLELMWTRIFSAEFYYTFSFLILSLAIMGLSMGSLSLRLFPKLNNTRFLSSYLGLSAIFSMISPVLLFKLGLDFSILFTSFVMILKFILSIILLSSSFFFGGIALGLLFKTDHQDMPRLYMADLVGAGLSVLLSVVLMNYYGTPAATFLISIPMIIAAFLISGRKYLAIVSLIVFGMLIGKADHLLESDRQERAPVIYKHWDAMSKIKVYGYNEYYRGINIDNLANTPVYGFDGNLNDSSLTGWDIDVENLIDRFDSCTFLSLGAGGGADVLQALGYGCSEVHAVEVNPHINKMMTDGDAAGYIIPDSIENKEDFEITTCNAFSGNIYNNERVKVVSEDARTYVKRHKNKFDVIYSLSSNTWAALGSGSFAFAENYIFTTEAFIDYWNALSEDGFLSMEHQLYMPRLVSSALDAMEELDVEDPFAHIAIYDLPQMRRKLLLLSKQPLTDELIQTAYGNLQTGRHNVKHLLYPKPDTAQDNMINSIVENGWRTQADSAHMDISPATDNKPFIAQVGLWRNFSFDKLENTGFITDLRGFPLTKSLLVLILGIILIVFLPLLIIPYHRGTDKLKLAPWLYFFCLGIAYITIEIVLMQKYALFIGASFYSIATVLLTLLLASGIGSRFAERFRNSFIFLAIVAFAIFNIVAFKFLVNNFSDMHIMMRSLITALVVFPLGFFMGMPFPKGSLKVKELVDWGFAVNGIASVFGSTLIMLIVFAFGFNVAILFGAGVYILAMGLLKYQSRW